LWVLVVSVALAVLLIGALLINIIAVNRLLVNEFIPGHQLCVTAIEAHAVNPHITIPPACGRVLSHQ